MTDIAVKPAHATSTLGLQIRRGISWNAVNLIANRGISIIVRLILARLLAPEAFGLIAMIVVSLGLVNIFTDFGLKNALIQRKRDSGTLLRNDSAFWFLVTGGALWTAAFILIAPPLIAWSYDQPQLNALATVMGFSIVLHSLSIVSEVRLTRRMRFKPLVIAEASGTLASSVVAISMAFAGAGVWALVAQQLVFVSLRSTLIWHFAKWHPRWRFTWQSLRDLMGFSGWMLGSQVAYFIRTNIDKIIIGLLLGPASLGIYTLAYMVTENIRTQLAKIITSVMLPVYSRMQSETQEIKPHYLAVTRAMTLLLFPFLLSIALYTNDIINFLFTETWQEAITPIKILASGGLVYAISGPSAEVLQGIGQARSLFKISLINLCILGIPSIWFLTLYFGLPGAASAMLVTFTGMRILSYMVLKKFLDITLMDLIRSIAPAIIIMLFIVILDELFIKGRAVLGVPLVISGYLFAVMASYPNGRKKITTKLHSLRTRLE